MVFVDLCLEAAEGFVLESDVLAEGGVAEEILVRRGFDGGQRFHEFLGDFLLQANEIGVRVKVGALGGVDGMGNGAREWDVRLAEHQFIDDIGIRVAGDEVEGVLGGEASFRNDVLAAQVLLEPVDFGVLDAEGFEADVERVGVEDVGIELFWCFASVLQGDLTAFLGSQRLLLLPLRLLRY